MENTGVEIFENFFLPQNDISALPSSAGLILFTDNQDKPIMVLTAANIRNAVKNKLAEQNEKTKRTDLKNITAKIYYSTCTPKFRLAVKHLATVKKIFGDNYKDYITLVRPCFVKINFADKAPCFSVTKKPVFKSGGKFLSPFISQKSAADFIQTLEDVFRLCRRPDIATNPQQWQSCPYLQMDCCCGICAGKTSSEEYQQVVSDAFAAGANPDEAIEKFQQQMAIAAKELNFESAGELKRKIEKLSSLKKPAYRWTGDLENLKIVHIDKSAKIKLPGIRTKKQTVAVFVMNFFGITDLGDFPADETEKINQAIEGAITERPTGCESSDRLEEFAIISYFLYRTGSTGQWINMRNKK
jgi:excinuclease ABC subunit C